MKKRVQQSNNNSEEKSTKKYLIRGIIIGIIIGLIIGIILVIGLIFIKVGNFSINEWSVANCTGNHFNQGGLSSLKNIPSSCSEDWTCTSWSGCVNNQQTRTCTDSNNCGTRINKPELIQCCGSSTPTSICTENWQCSDWSSCVNNQQTRTCTDSNNCGTTSNKPILTLVLWRF